MSNPIWVIPESLAKNRIGKFSLKKAALETEFNITNETVSFNFTQSQFSSLIGAILSTKNIGGIRIYFANIAAPQTGTGRTEELGPNSKNKLALIIVPTGEKQDQNNTETASDLMENIFFIFRNSNNRTTIRMADVTATDDKERIHRWKHNYQANKKTLIESIFNLRVGETKSIWYSIPIFRTRNQTLPGILDFVEYPKNNIDGVRVHFASRKPGEEFSNQLDIVFELIDSNEKPYYTCLYSNDIRENLKKMSSITSEEEAKISSTYGDTGIPCPPRICN